MNEDDREVTRDLLSEIDVLSKAIQEESDSRMLCNLYFRRGGCFGILNERVKAVADYLSALEFAEKDAVVAPIHAMIALVFAKTTSDEQTLYWAMSAVERNPDDSLARFVFGLVCSNFEFFGFAIESLRKVPEGSSEHWAARLKLGVCIRENGPNNLLSNLDESVEILSGYVAAHPHDPTGLYELGRSIQLSSLWREERKEQAMQLFEKALSENPPLHMRGMIQRKIDEIKNWC